MKAKTNLKVSRYKAPLVSIIMPVYNGEAFLSEAIDSVLSQTYKNFELIIINDGSTDKSEKIIKSYSDPRIVFISQKNKGLSRACNKGIGIAKGKYVARQDDDDISLPHRLEKQVWYLEANTNVGLVGTNFKAIGRNGDTINHTNVFTKDKDIRPALIFSNQFGHGSIMVRKSIIKKAGCYDPAYRIAQDYDLWVRISKICEVSNLKECLYLWRQVGEGLSTSSANIEKTAQEALSIRNREIASCNPKTLIELIYLRPFSTKEGVKKYLEKKNVVYRNISLMYFRKGYRRFAIPTLFLAIIVSPWVKKTYKQLFFISRRQGSLNLWVYDEI